MKLLKALVLTVSLVTGLGSAGGVGGVAILGVAAVHADSATKTKLMSAADVTRWLAFFDKLVSTVSSSPASCDKLAVDVAQVIDQNKDAIEIARNARATGRKLPEAAQQHMLEGVKKMVPAMQKCGQHDKVRAAFAKLDLNRRA